MIRTIFAAAIIVAPVSVPSARAELARDRRIDAADAQTITDTCLALAARSGWKVHVAVLNEYGDLIRFVGMDGATRTSGVLAQGKARTVFRTGRSTSEVAKMDPSAQNAFDAVAIGGGLPVIVDGRMIGVAASSGALPGQDEVYHRGNRSGDVGKAGRPSIPDRANVRSIT